MPPPPMSTKEGASNGQWQGPLVMLQPVLIIALVVWVKFIFGYVLSLFSAPVVRMCAEQLKDCVFEWRCFASLASAWQPDTYLTLCHPLTAEECHACLVQHHVVFNLYVSECLHQGMPNTVPFNLALLLLILTKKLNVVFVLCCQRWHTWVTTAFLP